MRERAAPLSASAAREMRKVLELDPSHEGARAYLAQATR